MKTTALEHHNSSQINMRTYLSITEWLEQLRELNPTQEQEMERTLKEEFFSHEPPQDSEMKINHVEDALKKVGLV